jgi:MFS family permease
MQRTSYRATAALGGTTLVVGSVLLLFITPDRSTFFVALAALVSGLGMGLSNNSFLIAVQSEVSAEDRGVATSSVVFMRMVGQSIGTAIFGGIVNAELAGHAGGADLVDRMLMPQFRQSLPLAELEPLLLDLGRAIRTVFDIDALLALGLLSCCLLLPRALSPTQRRQR